MRIRSRRLQIQNIFISRTRYIFISHTLCSEAGSKRRLFQPVLAERFQKHFSLPMVVSVFRRVTGSSLAVCRYLHNTKLTAEIIYTGDIFRGIYKVQSYLQELSAATNRR